jgi:long-chain acyl-CoA synthetase
MNVVSWLERAARASPDAVAIYHGRSRWATYADLARRASAIAHALRGRMGLSPGDRVAIAMPNSPEYLELVYGIWWAGLAAVPINAKLHAREIAFIREHSEARLLVEAREQVAELRGDAEFPLQRADSASLAWIFYTSGTTGRPKGAMLSHRNLTQMTMSYFADVDAVHEDGTLLHAAPLSHGSGLYNFTHLVKGAAQAVPESGGFDAGEVLDLLEAHRNVSLFAAPTIVKRLADAALARDARASGLQTLVYGGGPMYLADLEHATRALGPRLAQIYGQGESPMTITALSKHHHADVAHPRHRERLMSVGLPHAVVEVAIRDAEGRDLAAGEAGEICVRGDVVMPGYWRDPDSTSRALRGGWLWTGDIGAFDEDGFLTLMDRSKDLIISGGSNIYPREIEEVLLRHPAVAEAAVVGRPDREWGESVVAFVVARGAIPATEELDRLCLQHVARFKRPREYRFVQALPKNNYGKVVKSELRALLSESEGTLR